MTSLVITNRLYPNNNRFYPNNNRLYPNGRSLEGASEKTNTKLFVSKRKSFVS